MDNNNNIENFCRCCRNFLKAIDFDIKYNGISYKTCKTCRLKQKKRYNKKICKNNKSFHFVINSKTIEPVLKMLNESGLHYEQINDSNMNESNMIDVNEPKIES